MSIAELREVTKRFGQVVALDRVSVELEPGEVLALLGANGAGKSTALALLLGLRRPDSGECRLFGVDPRLPQARRGIGVALQESAFPVTLRVHELLEVVRAHFPTPADASLLLRRFRLEPLAGKQVGALSVGQRRLVAVALAFAGRGRLVVLDEPTAGLDGDARSAVWDAIRDHADAGGTALLTTHYLDEADSLATRVVLLDGGVVLAEGTVGAIKAAAGLTRVRFRAPPGRSIDGARRIGAHLVVYTDDGGATVARLVRDGVPLDDLEVRPLSLEEAIAIRRAPR